MASGGRRGVQAEVSRMAGGTSPVGPGALPAASPAPPPPRETPSEFRGDVRGHCTSTPNSKHVDIRHHFIRERMKGGEFKVVHVRSDLQRAGFLTKRLPKEIFYTHRDSVVSIR